MDLDRRHHAAASDGSVAILDGRVVGKLSEEYIPKQDYELAYEDRK